MHIIDASDPEFERQLEVTLKVLEEIGAKAVPRILVFNKIDCVGDTAAQAASEAAMRVAIMVFFQKDLIEASIFLPWTTQKQRGEIFAKCEVLEEHADSEGAFFRIRGERDTVNALREQLGAAAE